eukprot:1136527-Pelagomonas_calceolata.AAC.2
MSVPKEAISNFCMSCLLLTWTQLAGRPAASRRMIAYGKLSYKMYCASAVPPKYCSVATSLDASKH